MKITCITIRPDGLPPIEMSKNTLDLGFFASAIEDHRKNDFKFDKRLNICRIIFNKPLT